MKGITVSDLMTRNPIKISPDSDLLKCAKTMVSKKVGSLLLVEKKEFVGFISYHDILWAVVKRPKEELESIRAKDISPRKIIKVKPDDPLDEALDKMKRYKFERLPVVKSNELVGMITARDILNFYPEFYQELSEFAEIREESEKLKRIEDLQGESWGEGVCEECGNTDTLYKIDGRLLCSGCSNQ
ncbi:MAG TPA: CBS domain-containing protein [Candidatus Nanoarchaeia archaeon]|nr:CBS domain-containing protein [Candidatus Nanoarchaeia archaeon]